MTHIISMCHILLLDTDAPASRKGWHHILPSHEEEESMDFGKKIAVSTSWNIIKLIICYTDAHRPHQPMDINKMTLIFMSTL